MNGRTCLLIGSCALLLLLASSAAAADDASTPPSGGASAVILFERLDRNGDGQLTADEVPAGRRALFDRLLQTADADKDGKLSRDEFAAGLESKRPERPVSEKLPERNPAGGAGIDPDRVFSRFDRNGDGKIVAGEVPDEARGIFERLLVRADKNGDGELTKQELVDAANQLKPPAAGKPGQMDPAKIFDYLDGNADGKLSADEIPDGRPMLQMLLKRGDRDGDGALSREEFMAGFAALRAAQEGEKPAANTPDRKPTDSKPADGGAARPKIAERLAQMDADRDGKISRQEFDARQQARFARLDANGDGYLEPSEIQQRIAARLQQRAGQKAAAGSTSPASDKPAANPPVDSESK